MEIIMPSFSSRSDLVQQAVTTIIAAYRQATTGTTDPFTKPYPFSKQQYLIIVARLSRKLNLWD